MATNRIKIMKTLIKTFAAITLAFTVNFVAAAQDEDYEHVPQHSSKRHNMFSRKDFGIYLGLNTYESKNLPELDNLNARYVALNWRKNHRLITGNNVDVALGTGFEFAWNNYMLKDNIRLQNQTIGANFVEVKESLSKSKLVVTSLNVPLMLQFGFKESHWHLGLGAFGGARIGSYMKTIGENGKKKDHSAYNLSKFHYGLAAELGRKNFAFFARYELSPMFQDKNPVNGNAIMFGIRL